jgi:hypothetical protein
MVNPRPILEYRPFIEDVLQQFPTLRAIRVFDMARERGYRGSLRTLRSVVYNLRPRPRHEAFLRCSVLPGEQAQFDWAHVGTPPVDGGTRPLWLFLGVLSWSRGMWGEFVFDFMAPALVRSLCRFVDVMGGTPREWLFDHGRVVVFERRGDAMRFHPHLLAVATGGPPCHAGGWSGRILPHSRAARGVSDERDGARPACLTIARALIYERSNDRTAPLRATRRDARYERRDVGDPLATMARRAAAGAHRRADLRRAHGRERAGRDLGRQRTAARAHAVRRLGCRFSRAWDRWFLTSFPPFVTG